MNRSSPTSSWVRSIAVDGLSDLKGFERGTKGGAGGPVPLEVIFSKNWNALRLVSLLNSSVGGAGAGGGGGADSTSRGSVCVAAVIGGGGGG